MSIFYLQNIISVIISMIELYSVFNYILAKYIIEL